MNDTNPLYDPAAEDYAAGRADQAAGRVDVGRAVASPAYRHGQADARTLAVDAELLLAADRGQAGPLPRVALPRAVVVDELAALTALVDQERTALETMRSGRTQDGPPEEQ